MTRTADDIIRHPLNQWEADLRDLILRERIRAEDEAIRWNLKHGATPSNTKPKTPPAIQLYVMSGRTGKHRYEAQR